MIRLRDIPRAIEAQVPRKALRDIGNVLRYGARAPLSDQAIFVAPRDVMALGPDVDRRRFRRPHSGAIRGGDWDLARTGVDRDRKLLGCRMRWVDGADWAETPQYRRMVMEISLGRRPDGCATVADVDARYAALDLLFEETRRRGRLLQRSELPESFRSEHGGVLLHVARDGTCLRGGGGAHRFAIARILDLPEMPGQLGVIHPQAIRDGHLAALSRSDFRTLTYPDG